MPFVSRAAAVRVTCSSDASLAQARFGVSVVAIDTNLRLAARRRLAQLGEYEPAVSSPNRGTGRGRQGVGNVSSGRRMTGVALELGATESFLGRLAELELIRQLLAGGSARLPTPTRPAGSAQTPRPLWPAGT